MRVFCHHDATQLPHRDGTTIPVHLYGLGDAGRFDISTIGHPAVDKIRRLGIRLPDESIDFFSIALSVTAADTFVLRGESADGWSREIHLVVPLIAPAAWEAIRSKFEETLNFLSGDIWSLEFVGGGYRAPTPYGPRHKLTRVLGCDSVQLFSGGLDSSIGAIDLLEQERTPLLISHAYTRDSKIQRAILDVLQASYSGVSRFAVNADPKTLWDCKTDITMRTRSLNFLAIAVLGSSAVSIVNQIENIDLFVPENGFISLNAPLTPRRTGSLSTRTTHPYYISSIQDIFDAVGIGATLKNPYQFNTKGEMVADCHNRALLDTIINETVSCSHWKRIHKQCGACVPCQIRRASLLRGELQETIEYKYETVLSVFKSDSAKDDVLALQQAIKRLGSGSAIRSVLNSGPLPHHEINSYAAVYERGLTEVAQFLTTEGL